MHEKWLRATLKLLLKCLFRVEIHGREHVDAMRGRPCVVMVNHQSFLDPLLLAVFLPEKPAFAMNVYQAQKWYFRPLLHFVDIFRIDPSQPMSTKGMIQRLRENRTIVVFPEGRITVTGGVMKVYEGTGMIIDRTKAHVVPAWVEGAKFTPLSRMRGKLRLRWFPKVTLTFQPPVTMNLPDELHGKERREFAARRMYDVLTEAAFRATHWQRPLWDAVLEGASNAGFSKRIATDITRTEMTYRSLITRVLALSPALSRALGSARNVGVLLPTSLGGMVAFFALHALGRVPAMLNFSAGARTIQLACEMALCDTIITSRAFIEKGNLQPLINALEQRISIVYLEDVREKIRPSGKLKALALSHFPRAALRKALRDTAPNDVAVIVYTSGSEGTPKGVALSHANILSNVAQAGARLSFTQQDVMFNALPIFHSFGLTIGTLLPLVLGIRTVLFPSPLQYRVIPEAVYDSDASILLGTDTFFNGYAKYAHAFDFFNVRLAVAGAEKLKDSTRQLYADRFRVNIMQGYGVTETSPAISFNTPVEHKAGTVGRIFPGMQTRLEPVAGLEHGGRLFVSGPNVMLGYIKHDQPGVIQPHGQWYDTGDIVEIDQEGFITIKGRAKRFAKIGGEMVSLTVVEEIASSLWPDVGHAALAVEDERKGEQIVLITEYQEATKERLLEAARAQGVPEIALPKHINYREKLPRLGSGKIDYITLKETLG